MEQTVIALLGNPNVGKTSLFNRLTKLHQKVGNYPGITVEKREGTVQANGKNYRLVDLPGTYTLFPSSLDEEVVFRTLTEKDNSLKPQLTVVVTEPSTIKRGIVLYQQARDLGLPAIFVVNMMDEAQSKGIEIDFDRLEAYLQTKVYQTNARNGKGISQLIEAFEQQPGFYRSTFDIPSSYHSALQEAKALFPLATEYLTWQFLAQEQVGYLTPEVQDQLAAIRARHQLVPAAMQKEETLVRHQQVEQDIPLILKQSDSTHSNTTYRIDRLLLHPFFGYVIFFGLLFLIFQAIFSWSGPLMDWIDQIFGDLTAYLEAMLPEGPLSALFTEGIVAGIGGIVIFLPQIVVLFLFLSLMEESGYMSRVVFLMDRWLRPFGLNGKSVIPLMSGAACAIPAVMSARNIENPKERLLTILVTPFMTCSARLPIYVVLIGLVIPEQYFLGFNLQGIALFVMYLLGIIGALASAWLLNKVIKSVRSSFLIFELPTYKTPDWKNMLLTVWEKASGFLFQAGKIILMISIILWVLGSFGPTREFYQAEEIVQQNYPELNAEQLENQVSSYQLEHSFLGYLGQGIEPFVRPLGYDWKMGIGLISSFAAREVFVGTMAVVYSMGGDVDVDDDNEKNTLLAQMRAEINANTGEPAYNLASGVSLLLFYAFAMQCMATIAIVRRETGSWKWTAIQTLFMTGLAYVVALLAYQILK